MRLFFAVEIPEDIKDKIESFKKNFENLKLKFVEKENLHITLKFLGEREDVEDILKKVEKINYKSFLADVRGFSAFPSIYSARILWVGVEPIRDFLELHKIISHSIKTEAEKNFIPHITIARLKKNYNLESIAAEKTFFGKFEVKIFSLMRSILTPSGPIYSKIKDFYLI